METFTTQQTVPRKSGFKKFMRIFLFLVIVILAFVFWWKYFYVFGEGVKSGELNYVVKKGNVFKTYEGKLIQSGFRSKAAGTVQSYEFEFSVVNDSIANILMNNSGNYFDLHYKEYKSTLPWRGFSPYIVDKIIKREKVAR
jgi:energy-coupling factor transporter transmembrane protein EcfT